MYNVRLCARFQFYLREMHLYLVKCTFRYLKDTANLVLHYKATKNFKLQGYCDVDYTGDGVERKSTS